MCNVYDTQGGYIVQSIGHTRCGYMCKVQDTQSVHIYVQSKGHTKCGYMCKVQDICAKYRIYVQSIGYVCKVQDTQGVCENKRVAPALDLCQALLRLALLHAVMVIIILPVITHVILLIIIIGNIIRVLFIILSSWRNLRGSNYFQVLSRSKRLFATKEGVEGFSS